MLDSNNDYDIVQIIFLLVISFAISMRDKVKNKECNGDEKR